jgi:hypothetical protein
MGFGLRATATVMTSDQNDELIELSQIKNPQDYPRSNQPDSDGSIRRAARLFRVIHAFAQALAPQRDAPSATK